MVSDAGSHSGITKFSNVVTVVQLENRACHLPNKNYVMIATKQYNYLLNLQYYLAITYVPAKFLEDFDVFVALLTQKNGAVSISRHVGKLVVTPIEHQL